MTVKEIIEELQRMNPDQLVVVNVRASKHDEYEYREIGCIAQQPKEVVLEIHD